MGGAGGFHSFPPFHRRVKQNETRHLPSWRWGFTGRERYQVGGRFALCGGVELPLGEVELLCQRVLLAEYESKLPTRKWLELPLGRLELPCRWWGMELYILPVLEL